MRKIQHNSRPANNQICFTCERKVHEYGRQFLYKYFKMMYFCCTIFLHVKIVFQSHAELHVIVFCLTDVDCNFLAQQQDKFHKS